MVLQYDQALESLDMAIRTLAVHQSQNVGSVADQAHISAISEADAMFTPSDIQIRSAQALMVAMAHEAMLRPIVEGYQREILVKHQFKMAAELSDRVGPESRVITEGKYSYLLGEDDFKVYLDESQMAQEAHGLKVSKPGNCPLLEALHARIDAQNALLKTWEGHPRFSVLAEAAELGLDERAKVIDLTLHLLAPYVKDNAHDMLADLGIQLPKSSDDNASPEL